jgi:hypothetical protein
MRKNLLCAFALLSSIFFSGISRAQSAPTISYTNPVNGPVGTSVKIVGSNFGSTQSSSTIAFNGTTATPTSWSNTQIVAPVPTGATTGPVVVTVGGVVSNHVNFTVGTPPTISYTNPVNGPAGTSVTIVGTYFGSTQGSSTLTFNGTLATPTSWSSTQIVTPVPSGATTGPVVVTVGGVVSNHVNFTVGTPPTISYTNPIDGPVGTTVTIAGNYFGSTQGSSTITFNGTPATPTSWSNTQIVTAVPTGAATGPVVVTVGSLASNHVNFIVGTPPTISYTNPIDGPVGTSITIFGNYFGSAVGNITFNGTAATPTSWSNTQIVVPVPSGASAGPVVVTAAGMASNSVNFIVGTPPTISYTNPVRAAVGSSITIIGNYFGTTQGSNTITFNGTAATTSSWGNTQIIVPIPTGSSTGPLLVAVGGMNSNSVNFTVVPNIISLSPSSAPVGSTVSITGTTFGLAQGSGTVTFNGTVASPSSWSDSQITVPVPIGASTGPVVVTAAGNASNSLNFTSLPTPSITSVSPASGSVGASVAITGTNFGPSQGSSVVTFNGTAATPTSWSSTSIVVPVPTGATTGNVVVTESGVASNPAAFSVLSGPNIASVSPTSGPAGTNVTVTGTGFGAGQGNGSLLLGSIGGLVTNWSDAQITAIVAPHSVSGSVQVTQGGVTSNSVPFTVTTPTITSVTPQSGGAGTPVTIAGSGFGTTQGNGSVLLGTLNGQVVSWSDTQVIATVAPNSASGRTQVIQGIGSDAVNFTVTPPAITSVNPTSGPAGTQVTVTGSGFGATQGSGKVLLGTAYGVVVSWSDTQVVAAVNTGSTSGYAQIIQGTASNSTSFTVAAPAITGASPASGTPGTQVTISGSNFGAPQANGNVWLGSAYGTVVSWSDTQVVATVASGSASGTVQILQNGVWSNSLPFNTGIPQVTTITPTSGTAGTQVTFSGSGFGATQGPGIVWLGNGPGSVVSWSDTQVVATVATGAVTGIARIQQNGVWSNSTRFVVPTVGSGNAVILVPQSMSMLVGQTRGIQALDSHGAAVTGLTWTSSDATIASLSTDDPPVITAVAPGHVTITGGDASADLTVYSGSGLPQGTVVWSAPGDGSAVSRIMPAVPSPNGVADVFALLADGNVQAITSDGAVAWTANVGNAFNALLPDFQGGLVESTSASISKLDGLTGQQTSQYAFANPGQHPIALHTDGTVFTTDGDSVVGIDPSTGIKKFSVALEHSTNDSANLELCSVPASQPHVEGPPSFGPMAVAGDGFLYVAYQYTNFLQTGNYCLGLSTSNSSHARMLRVDSSGNWLKIPLGDISDNSFSTTVVENAVAASFGSESVSGLSIGVSAIITNADSGVELTWSGSAPAYCATTLSSNTGEQTSGCVAAVNQSGLMTVSSNGTVSRTTTPGSYNLRQALQGADGTYYGPTDTAPLTAFDASGNIKWSVPGYYPAMMTADGGLVAQSADGLTTATFDANGNATGQIGNLPQVTSWLENGYNLGSIEEIYSLVPKLAATFAALLQGNASANGTPIQQQPYPPLTSCNNPTLKNPPACPGPAEVANSGLAALKKLLSVDCSLCRQWVFAKLPGGSVDGGVTVQSQFSTWLKKTPGLYDGTISTLPQWWLCSEQLLGQYCLGVDLTNPFTFTSKPKIADYFISNPFATNLAKTPSHNGYIAFYNTNSWGKPSCYVTLSSDTTGTREKSITFHEALHGFSGLDDPNLRAALGAPILQGEADSEVITDYIAHKVFGWPANFGGITQLCQE